MYKKSIQMNIFHCGHCQNLVFFENTSCVQCKHLLAYLPDQRDMAALEPAGNNLWFSKGDHHKRLKYRLCRNYETEKVCNWAVPSADANPYCLSCRLTRVIPDLKILGNREAWAKLESAKRRLVHNILSFALPLVNKVEDPERGLAFEFLADPEPGAAKVMTGHNNGVITINLAEADDGEREKRRNQLREPYRTILGHFRHETGHYYWDRLIKNSPNIEHFRKLFGNEQENYGQALQDYHKKKAPADWQQRFVSAYASAHPWEDWAESWAHYLHITDSVDTAEKCGLILKPARSDEPALEPTAVESDGQASSFGRIIKAWTSLTYVLNNLNRGLGLSDAYPFVLSAPALEKLAFIHQIIGQNGKAVQTSAASILNADQASQPLAAC
jgi:hypothetical protein